MSSRCARPARALAAMPGQMMWMSTRGITWAWLAIAALAMFNRGQQDVSEDQVGADLKAIDEDLMTRAREDEAAQRVVGEFFFVHAAEARPLGPQSGRRGGWPGGATSSCTRPSASTLSRATS